MMRAERTEEVAPPSPVAAGGLPGSHSHPCMIRAAIKVIMEGEYWPGEEEEEGPFCCSSSPAPLAECTHVTVTRICL